MADNSILFAAVLKEHLEKWRHVFPDHPVTERQIDIYTDALSDLDPELLDYACIAALRSATEFPKPGHIRLKAKEWLSS